MILALLQFFGNNFFVSKKNKKHRLSLNGVFWQIKEKEAQDSLVLSFSGNDSRQFASLPVGFGDCIFPEFSEQKRVRKRKIKCQAILG